MQHKLESGYKSVKQQHLSVALSLALSSPVSFPTITCVPGRLRCAGNCWWQSKQVFPNCTNTQWAAASQYNADLKKKPHNNKPKHKKNPNQASAQLWDSIKYCCPVRNQCYHSSAEHAAPTAAPAATGSTFTDRLCQTQTGINITPGTELGPVFQSCLSWAAWGVPKARDSSTLCSGVPMTGREWCAHYRAAVPGSAGQPQAQRCHPIPLMGS